MSSNLPLITTIASALGLALIMGFFAIKLKLPTVVGYLLAGVIIGPFTPGFVADSKIAAELADIGVMLLMFGVGLHFSLENLLETRKIALPGAIFQILVATTIGALVSSFWGWSLGGSLVFGLALSVASTVVLIRALENMNIRGSINGQIAIGWLIVEDLAMILVLVFLPFFAKWLGGASTSQQSLGLIFVITCLKITIFITLMLVIGRRLFPWILWNVAKTGSHELFTLCVIAAAVSIAFAASKLFGISFALGAFFAGMIIRESKFSRRAAEESLPFRDAFAVLFFVSIGMLFNPQIIIEHPLKMLIVVAIIVLGKSLAAAILVICLRYPLNTALTVSASLAQIGEFSFILAGVGMRLGLLPKEGQDLILAGSLLSITLNPLLFKSIEPLQAWLVAKSQLAQKLEQSPPETLVETDLSHDAKYLTGPIILVGYGRVGRRIKRLLAKQEMPFIIVDQDAAIIKALKKANIKSIYGNASEPDTLNAAEISQAGMLVIATSNVFNIKQIVKNAHQLNPSIEIVIRAQNRDEVSLLKTDINAKFFFHESELAKGMSRYILGRFGLSYPS